MNPVSVDVKDILEADSGLGLEFGANLFVGKEPDKPNECVTLYDTGGKGPRSTFEKSEKYYYHRLQVRVRSTSYLSGMTLAQEVMDVLHGLGHEEWNNTTYELIRAISSPLLIGRDGGRIIIVVNFDVQRRES